MVPRIEVRILGPESEALVNDERIRDLAMTGILLPFVFWALFVFWAYHVGELQRECMENDGTIVENHSVGGWECIPVDRD